MTDIQNKIQNKILTMLENFDKRLALIEHNIEEIKHKQILDCIETNKYSKYSGVAIEFNMKNPKKKNSATYQRYEKYKQAKTKEDAIKLGASLSDINYDIDKGYAKLLDNSKSHNNTSKSFNDIVSLDSHSIISILNSKTKLRNEQSQVYPMLIIDWINSIQPCEEYFDYVIKLDFIEGISTIFHHIYDNNKDNTPITSYVNKPNVVFVYDVDPDADTDADNQCYSWREYTDKEFETIIHYIKQSVLKQLRIWIEQNPDYHSNPTKCENHMKMIEKITGSNFNYNESLKRIKTNIFNYIKSDLK